MLETIQMYQWKKELIFATFKNEPIHIIKVDIDIYGNAVALTYNYDKDVRRSDYIVFTPIELEVYIYNDVKDYYDEFNLLQYFNNNKEDIKERIHKIVNDVSEDLYEASIELEYKR